MLLGEVRHGRGDDADVDDVGLGADAVGERGEEARRGEAAVAADHDAAGRRALADRDADAADDVVGQVTLCVAADVVLAKDPGIHDGGYTRSRGRLIRQCDPGAV